MQLQGIEYIDGTIDYDSSTNEHLRFQLPVTETEKVVKRLKTEGIVDLERAYAHLQNTRLGIRQLIDGLEPKRPYINARMERLGNGSTEKDSVSFEALKEGGLVKAEHAEEGKLTIARIAEVLGIS